MKALQLRIISLANAGFAITRDQRRILVDPFIVDIPGLPEADPAAYRPGDLILITHLHWDHLNRKAVITAALSGAQIIGPQPVCRKLAKAIPADRLVTLEPADIGAQASFKGDNTKVTAFRTRHGRGHNSYLIEWHGYRLFHDGDNEHTEDLDRDLLQGLDVLMISTWLGAGWVEFIDALRPASWLLMHLSAEEIAACKRGEYFDGLCDHVPAGLTVLKPGEAVTIEKK